MLYAIVTSDNDFSVSVIELINLSYGTEHYAWFFLSADLTGSCSPVWARERCRISPPRLLAECLKR